MKTPSVSLSHAMVHGTAESATRSVAERRPAGELAMASFPVLSSTQLCLELMMGGPALDLRATVDLVSRDPVAVLRIFSAVAREFPETHNRPERLEECIVSLTSEDLLAALCQPPSPRSEQGALVAFARHSTTIAHFACVAAASLGLAEERAYLVGLLHAIGTLPAELGRAPMPVRAEELFQLGAAIARHHHVPAELRKALEAVHREDPRSLWVALIQAAHDLAADVASGVVRRS